MNSAILNTYAVNEPSTVLNPFDLRSHKGLASFNLAHQFNANFSYPLPFGRGHQFGGFNLSITPPLQFRAEAFNVTNHTNFALPNPAVFSGTSYSASAGILTQTAGTSRQIQFALKLIF